MFGQKNIMLRYTFIVFVMALIAVAVIIKAAFIMFAERQYWKDVADRFVKENVTVAPTRGNIISADGKLMASSLPEYKIYMDFVSVLGPIDPQVQNKEGRFVPALGYLDKINDLLEKAKDNTLTQAEFLILKDFDLAELRGYEQARDLSIDLLKKWLVKYKFKNWNTHQTNNIGAEVTLEQKEERARDIATILSDNHRWKTHGRPINIETLEKELKLKIEDYSNDLDFRNTIRTYYTLSSDYVRKNNIQIFIHTKNYI